MEKASLSSFPALPAMGFGGSLVTLLTGSAGH